MGPMGPATYDASVADSLREFAILFAVLLVAYAICIIVVGRLARKKGRDPARWTFYAVLFGPLALVAVALSPQFHYADHYLDENGWPKRRRWGWGRRRSSSRRARASRS